MPITRRLAVRICAKHVKLGETTLVTVLPRKKKGCTMDCTPQIHFAKGSHVILKDEIGNLPHRVQFLMAFNMSWSANKHLFYARTQTAKLAKVM